MSKKQISPLVKLRPKAALRFVLDEDQADALVKLCWSGEKDEPPSSIGLDVCNGHSGYGLYVWLAEYPEEGAIFLGKPTKVR